MEKDEASERKYYRRPTKSLFSIHQNVVEEKDNEENLDDDIIDLSLPQDSFSKEDFQKFWNSYKAKIQKKNKPLYNVLDTLKWNLKDKHQIHLIFDSSMMIMEFDKSKDDFVKKVRKKLNNYAIRVFTEVTKDKNTKSHIKSRKDIFNELVEKNPNIVILAQRLGLDIENEPD